MSRVAPFVLVQVLLLVCGSVLMIAPLLGGSPLSSQHGLASQALTFELAMRWGDWLFLAGAILLLGTPRLGDQKQSTPRRLALNLGVTAVACLAAYFGFLAYALAKGWTAGYFLSLDIAAPLLACFVVRGVLDYRLPAK